MLSIEPVDRLSSTNTSSPRFSSASARWEPTNPAPPVMRTRTCDSLLLNSPAGARRDGPGLRMGGRRGFTAPRAREARLAQSGWRETDIIQEPHGGGLISPAAPHQR